MAREITLSDARTHYLMCQRDALDWEAKLQVIPPEAPDLRRIVQSLANEARARTATAYAVFLGALEVRLYDEATDPDEPDNRKTADAARKALARITTEAAR